MLELRKLFFINLFFFLFITLLVSLHLTDSIDFYISNYFDSLSLNNIDFSIFIITSVSDVFTLIIIAIVLTIIKNTRRIGLIFLISIVVISISIIYIKPVIGRENPLYYFNPQFSLPDKFTLEGDSMLPLSRDFSYPSNHIAIITSLSFLVYNYLSQKRKKFSYIIWSVPFIIGFTKLYIFQHFFTDILGGFAFGIIITIILSKILRVPQQENNLA